MLFYLVCKTIISYRLNINRWKWTTEWNSDQSIATNYPSTQHEVLNHLGNMMQPDARTFSYDIFTCTLVTEFAIIILMAGTCFTFPTPTISRWEARHVLSSYIVLCVFFSEWIKTNFGTKCFIVVVRSLQAGWINLYIFINMHCQ